MKIPVAEGWRSPLGRSLYPTSQRPCLGTRSAEHHADLEPVAWASTFRAQWSLRSRRQPSSVAGRREPTPNVLGKTPGRRSAPRPRSGYSSVTGFGPSLHVHRGAVESHSPHHAAAVHAANSRLLSQDGEPTCSLRASLCPTTISSGSRARSAGSLRQWLRTPRIGGSGSV